VHRELIAVAVAALEMRREAVVVALFWPLSEVEGEICCFVHAREVGDSVAVEGLDPAS
jgi:hypothetical protein